MKDFVFNIKQQIESEIKNIEYFDSDPIIRTRQIVYCTETAINDLKEFTH